MRILPLPSSASDPEPWLEYPALELAWNGNGAAWRAAVGRGLEVHALHFPEPEWRLEALAPVLEAHRAGLQPDFLVLGATASADLAARSAMLGCLEFLLEAVKGPRLVLRAGATSGALAALLRDVRGEAIGFCWDPTVPEAEAIADRLCCAVANAEADLEPLARLGYRWNVAVPSLNRQAAKAQISVLTAKLPPPDFPVHAPAGPEPEGIAFGAAWTGVKP